MKHLFTKNTQKFRTGVIFMIALALSCTNSGGETPMKLPTADALFAQLAIDLPNAESRVYAFTDRVGGFWEGQTFGYNANGGFNIDGNRELRDILISADGALLNRKSAENVHMLPHQIQRRFSSDATETITVLSGQMGMIVSLNSSTPVAWEVQPFVGYPVENMVVDTSEIPQLLFAKDRDSKYWMAVYSAANSNLLPATIDAGTVPEPLNPAHFIRQKWVSEKAAHADIVFLFGENKAELAQKIREIGAAPEQSIAKRKQEIAQLLQKSWFQTNDPQYDKALNWAKIAGNELVVQQFGKGIWAGLPWFNQSWGRDTFIALPGISLVTGQFADAADIIRSFSDYQITDPQNELFGRVPNRVNSPDDIIYNTTDGTPWLIREIAEYVFFTGDTAFARQIFPVIQRAISGAKQNFLDQNGLMTHANADTWMDAKIRGNQAWSPRGDRAVDIQALWFNQLKVSAALADVLGEKQLSDEWHALAEQVKLSFNKYFRNPVGNVLYDHINPDNSPDVQIRPNQMFALTIPQTENLIDSDVKSGVVRQVVSELTYPYGVASLSQNDRYFHPYHHDQIYHFDAAYHNGLCWQWNAGPVIGGMVEMGYQHLAFELTENLTDQILNEGMPGSMSELVLPGLAENGALQLSGTYSQAWSVSEFVRNFYQDYLGVRVNMLRREIVFAPRLPEKLTSVRFLQNFGRDEQIEIAIESAADGQTITFWGTNLASPVNLKIERLSPEFAIFATGFTLRSGETITLKLDDSVKMSGELNGNPLQFEPTGASIPKPSADLKFQTFRLNPNLEALKTPDFLEKIRVAEAP